MLFRFRGERRFELTKSIQFRIRKKRSDFNNTSKWKEKDEKIVKEENVM